MMTSANHTLRRVFIHVKHTQDELITFAGADTYKEGTILARDTSTGKLVPFVIGGSTDGNGVINCVLMDEITVTAAGDVPHRPLMAGEVFKDLLVVHADGDASNLTAAHIDQLRGMGIIAETSKELGIYDNS